MKKSSRQSVRLVFKLEPFEPESLPDAELRFSVARVGNDKGISILASALTVPENDADNGREEFSFYNGDIVATYSGGKLCDLEVLRCAPSPRDPELAGLWSFVKERDDALLAAAVHTTMSIWLQIHAGLLSAECERQKAELEKMTRELFGEAPRTAWVSCKGPDHSIESVWTSAVA
ncbi:MAG: hypothetical protein ACYTGW_11815 [Planctomycetota bacterium]|jgi:hypothetical protein